MVARICRHIGLGWGNRINRGSVSDMTQYRSLSAQIIISWRFILYKVPKKRNLIGEKTSGTEFFYMADGAKFFTYKTKTDITKSKDNPLYKTLEPIYNRVCIKSVYRNMCYQNSMFLNFITYDCNHLYLYFSYLYFGAFCSLQSLKPLQRSASPRRMCR